MKKMQALIIMRTSNFKKFEANILFLESASFEGFQVLGNEKLQNCTYFENDFLFVNNM